MTAILVAMPKPLQSFAILLLRIQSLHDIPLEPVYTGKLFWWLNRELQSGQLQEDTEVILIHSGGLFPNEKP